VAAYHSHAVNDYTDPSPPRHPTPKYDLHRTSGRRHHL